jgi:hypothetical protein
MLFSFSYTFSQENSKKEIKDESRNEGYFNITKLSFIKVNFAELEIFTSQSGNVVTDLTKSEAYSLQTINGIFLNPFWSIGIGVGLDGYNNPNINTLPIFIDVRSYFTEDKDSPYLYVDGGILAKLGSVDLNKGSILNLGAGYKFFVSKRLALVTDVSYNLKSISLTDEPFRSSSERVTVRGLTLSLGVIF